MKKFVFLLFIMLVACDSSSVSQNPQELQLASKVEELQDYIEKKDDEIEELSFEVERIDKLMRDNKKLEMELENKNKEIQNLLSELKSLNENLALDNKRMEDRLSNYMGEVKLLKKTLDRSILINNKWPSNLITQEEVLLLIQNAIKFIGGNFKYDTLMCSSTETFESLYLVTDERIKNLDGLKSHINTFYSKQITEDFVNRFVKYEGNQIEQPMYIAQNDKLYTVCGAKGKPPMIWEEWSYSLLDLIHINDENDKFTVKLILPIREDSEQYNENRFNIYFREKEIDLIKVNDEWRLNTDLFDLS